MYKCWRGRAGPAVRTGASHIHSFPYFWPHTQFSSLIKITSLCWRREHTIRSIYKGEEEVSLLWKTAAVSSSGFWALSNCRRDSGESVSSAGAAPGRTPATSSLLSNSASNWYFCIQYTPTMHAIYNSFILHITLSYRIVHELRLPLSIRFRSPWRVQSTP